MSQLVVLAYQRSANTRAEKDTAFYDSFGYSSSNWAQCVEYPPRHWFNAFKQAKEITIGQVSAAINACIIVVQITLPLAIVFILVGVLENRNNAITWSVIDRMFQKSLWPTLLDSDSVASKGVHKRVSILSYISIIGTVLLLATGIVTPLGLSEGIRGGLVQNPHFKYAPDSSLFGLGTPSRGAYSLSRLCGSWLLQVCPGQTDTGGLTTYKNSTTWGLDTGPNDTGWIDAKIPKNITEIFTSADGAYGVGVANVFDIQYRTFQFKVYNDSQKRINNGEPYVQGQMRFFESLVLNNRYDVVEGLVVDTKKAGVGFRNHTIPANTRFGASWGETLLWVEPLTACVNNNLTVDYTIGDDGLMDLRLTDRGGFMNLPQTAPPPLDRDVSQTEPALYARAYKGAFTLNIDYAVFFNLSFKNVSRQYGTSYNFNQTDSLFYSLYPDISSPWKIGTNPLPGNASILCRGFGGADPANITNIGTACGVVRGVAERTDSHADDRGFMFETGSTWRHPIYTCASTIQASLKRVSFLVNGTADLKNLQVVSVDDILYPANESKPLWAVEKTGMQISEVEPIWGLVDERYEGHESLWTLRGSRLLLPAGAAWGIGSATSDSLAGAGFPLNALMAAYTGLAAHYDYTGKGSYAIATRWKELSGSLETVAAIPGLIWTDIMANMVMGSRSIIGTDGEPVGQSPEVTVFNRKIIYNPLYAVPAVVLLIVWILLCISALALWIAARVTIPALRQFLNQTATGRAVANTVYPDMGDSTARTSAWTKGSGMKMLGLVAMPGPEGDGKAGPPDPVGICFTGTPGEGPVRDILALGTRK